MDQAAENLKEAVKRADELARRRYKEHLATLAVGRIEETARRTVAQLVARGENATNAAQRAYSAAIEMERLRARRLEEIRETALKSADQEKPWAHQNDVGDGQEEADG